MESLRLAIINELGKASTDDSVPLLFQNYVAQYLVRNNKHGMKSITRGIVKYSEMEKGVLYYPMRSEFPFCEMYCRVGDELHLVQVTTQKEKKQLTNGALACLLNELNFGKNADDQKRIHLFTYMLHNCAHHPTIIFKPYVK